MKRLEEKVKDIVEVRATPGLTDFLADPAATLIGYHFTDITADLMAKWVGQIADVKRGRGAAFALAGFRGVGKSHFLAALGAIVSQPELRTKISDTHVMATAQRLSRRHGVVAHLKRGSSDSLLSELKIAIAAVTGTGTGEFSDSLNEILLAASEKAGDTPFVLLIDTAFGREQRVARDDGILLSEIAAAAVVHGIFVGIALDDDIAGADGLNSSIASSFAIDYLDQEHLYKIVDANVFPKHEQMRGVLHDIYNSYRSALPGFRWSEHRFSCLYPMHPAILEIAPFVRLYLQEFALLGFAVEAGIRILGRPANSLIGLDEVFDSVEKRLRGVDDLKEAFAAFDTIDKNVISKIPVMKRLEAKLILKGLFLLSLNGEGVTATELSAAMLIFDEAAPSAAAASVDAVLHTFAESTPNAIKKTDDTDREAKFSFKVGGGESLNSVLDEAIKTVSNDAVELVLRRQTAEKFSDFDISDDGSSIWATCYVVWRGGIRPGEVIWQAGSTASNDLNDETGNWKIFVRYGSPLGSENASLRWPGCEWVLGDLSSADVNTIRRFHTLQTDTALRENFRESVPTALHAHSIALEKIWQRIFLEESRLVCGDGEYKFSDAAKSSNNLGQLFTLMLEDQLEKQFPSHPEFSQVLGEKEVSLVTENLFSGSGNDNPEIQKHAVSFALPLGLVREQEGVYVPQPANDLAETPIVKQIFDLNTAEKTDVIPLSEVSKLMRSAPYGLTQEAQHLVLGALVAQRQFEFVTSSENRINHRSLDLQIIWEDIVGIVRPSDEGYSNERLLSWVERLTGNDTLTTLKSSDAQARLEQWLSEWQKARLVERFDLLPDEKLNSKLWRVASNVKKTFGVVAEAVDNLLQDKVKLDGCLQIIADVFADSEEEFESKKKDLDSLGASIGRLAERDKINTYLTLCEPTNNSEIEELRCSLIEELATSYFESKNGTDAELEERWERFKTLYSDLYAERHDAVVPLRQKRAKLDEFLSTDMWATFADLSEIPWFGRHDMEVSMNLIRELRRPECSANVKTMLEAQPFCVCSFKLTNAASVDEMISDLEKTVVKGMEYFRHKFLSESTSVALGLNAIKKVHNGETLTKLNELATFLDMNKAFPKLAATETHLLKVVTQQLERSNSIHNDRRRPDEPILQLHPDDIRQLEDELDSLQDPWKINT
ncbi:MAG: ATP-binding protein [Chloracidobacterium sp.]|nr:ATP-binding protein [Chloracidobacterium sp.]